jgi:hypothetical protein
MDFIPWCLLMIGSLCFAEWYAKTYHPTCPVRPSTLLTIGGDFIATNWENVAYMLFPVDAE